MLSNLEHDRVNISVVFIFAADVGVVGRFVACLLVAILQCTIRRRTSTHFCPKAF
jgi:hypothetical protein